MNVLQHFEMSIYKRKMFKCVVLTTYTYLKPALDWYDLWFVLWSEMTGFFDSVLELWLKVCDKVLCNSVKTIYGGHDHIAKWRHTNQALLLLCICIKKNSNQSLPLWSFTVTYEASNVIKPWHSVLNQSALTEWNSLSDRKIHTTEPLNIRRCHCNDTM